MTIPMFYVKAEVAKLFLYMTQVCFLLKYLEFIVNAAILHTFVWVNENLPSSSVPYYAVLSQGLQSNFWIGINGFGYAVFYYIKISPIIFIAFGLFYVMGCKGKQSWLLIVGPVFVTILDAVVFLFLIVLWVQCKGYAFCRTQVYPYLETEKNWYFNFIFASTGVSLVIQIVAVLFMILSKTFVQKAVEEEEDGGVNRSGPKIFEFLCFPSFYAEGDGVLFNIFGVIVATIIQFLLWLFAIWYLDRFIWTNINLPSSSIPYFNVLPSWMQTDPWIGLWNVSFMIFFIIVEVLWTVFILGPLVLISGCKRPYSYVIIIIFCVISALLNAIFALFTFVWVQIDCKNFSWCRTTVAPYIESNVNFFFLVIVWTSLATVVVNFITLILMWTMKLGIRIETIDEAGNGAIAVGGGLLEQSSSSEDENEQNK